MPTPAHEPFLIAEVSVDATDQTIETLTRMLDRAHRAGRHAHFVCRVVGFDATAPGDPWAQPAFVALCGRLVAAGFASFLDASTLYPPGQPDHLQAGFGALELWMVSRGTFGGRRPTAAELADARGDIDRGRAAALAAEG